MRREEVIAALGALAQESRLDIFRMLVQKGPDPVAAGEIARKLDLPRAHAFVPPGPAQTRRPLERASQ